MVFDEAILAKVLGTKERDQTYKKSSMKIILVTFERKIDNFV